MICNRCGHEINEGANFCPKCGLRAVAVPQPQLEDLTQKLRSGAQFVREHVPTDLDVLTAKVGDFGQQLKPYLQGETSLNRPIAYLGAALMQVLMVFLWFADCMHVAVLGYGENRSMHELFGGVEYMSYITVAMLLVSAVSMLLPVLVPSVRKLRNMLFPRFTSVWTTCMLVLGILSGAEAEKQYSNFNASVGLTMGGFLLSFLCIGTMILIFTISKKKANHRPRYLENN